MKFKQLIILIILWISTIQCNKNEETIPPVKVPEEGLVAYYPFSGNADDESGNSHNGIMNGAQLETDRLGNSNQSIQFDGVNDYLELNEMKSFGSSLDTFSVSFWIKADTLEVTNYESLMAIINNEGAGTMFSIIIHRGPNTTFDIGRIRFDLRDNLGRVFYICVHRPDIFDNEWHNITFNISSSKDNLGTVFIDGEFEANDPLFVTYGSHNPSDFDSFDYDFIIGAANNRGTIESYFKGSLDEMVFYNRSLTTKEILQLFDR
jgi:hypothetical protein